MRNKLAIAILICLVLSSVSDAVGSKITRQNTSADLLKGRTEDTVIGSQGTVQLGRAAEVLVKEFKNTWSINSIVVSGGAIFVGTSPNGIICKYSMGELTKIYPAEPAGNKDKKAKTPKEPNDANEVQGKKVEIKQYLSNEHIFAMATDVSGRVLAAVSGKKCALMRLEKDKFETIFEPQDAKYIFAVTLDEGGDIYLGTGPNGKVFRLSSLGKDPQLIYQAKDKNILSLEAGKDGFIYAGSDGRGLVYKINPRTKTATVLYDSEQDEITSLLFASGSSELYAAATSAQIAPGPAQFAAQIPLAGRPEAKEPEEKEPDKAKGGTRLQIANKKKEGEGKQPQAEAPPAKGIKPTKASYIYKITSEGYVDDIFSEAAVFFCLAEQDKKMLLGTGNNAQLFSVDPAAEEQAVIYEDQQASQITTVVVAGNDVYLGTANPAKLIKLSRSYASEGTYTSDLIDASQPAKWGKLQIEADIPEGCKVLVESRSGNVKDINDPSFSAWTEAVEVTAPVQLSCPLGRFCQYKLVLRSPDGKKTPVVREIVVADTIPNLAPKVESVDIARLDTPDKMGVFKINYKAKDNNGDKLIYKIDFRKIGRTNWIQIKDQLEADNFEWDGRTAEDGRYEIRVTASDERSNSEEIKLTGSRISEPVVVDNTAPVIKRYTIEKGEKVVTLKFQVSDQLSVIGKVNYTVDSNAEWIGAVPDDLVCDTTDEDFTLVIKDLKPGEHIITVRAGDDIGNTMYKTFEVDF